MPDYRINLSRHLSVLSVSGVDAATYLQGQLTCDIAEVQSGKTHLGLSANLQGRIVAAFFIFYADNRFILVLPSETLEKFLTQLKKYAQFSKVSFLDESEGFDIWALSPTSPMNPSPDVFQHAISSSLSLSLFPKGTPTGMDAVEEKPLAYWHYERIRAGLPEIHAVTQEKFLPHALNFPALGAISFTKGCYRGQEIIARMHYRATLKQALYRVHADTPLLPEEGSAILSESGETLGEWVNVLTWENQLCALVHFKIDRSKTGWVVTSEQEKMQLIFENEC